MKTIRSIAMILLLVAMLLATGCAKPAATVPDKVADDSPIAARDSVIAADASAKDVAIAFIEALGSGRVDGANALASAPIYRVSDEPSAGIADVSILGGPAIGSPTDWPVQMDYTVEYSAQTGSERFPKGPGRAIVSLIKDGESAPWKVLGIRVVD